MKLALSLAALLMTGAAHANTKVINGCDVILIPNTNAYYRADAKCPVGYVSQGNGSFPARSAKPADPIDVVDPIDPPAPGCLNSGGDCNNGHGNDDDGHDESNPGKSK